MHEGAGEEMQNEKVYIFFKHVPAEAISPDKSVCWFFKTPLRIEARSISGKQTEAFDCVFKDRGSVSKKDLSLLAMLYGIP